MQRVCNIKQDGRLIRSLCANYFVMFFVNLVMLTMKKTANSLRFFLHLSNNNNILCIKNFIARYWIIGSRLVAKHHGRR